MPNNFDPIDAVSADGEYTAYIYESKQIIAVFVNDERHDHFRCPEIRDMKKGDRLVIEVEPGFEVRSNGKLVTGKRLNDRVSFTIIITAKTPENQEIRVCRDSGEMQEVDHAEPAKEPAPAPAAIPQKRQFKFTTTAVLGLIAAALAAADISLYAMTMNAGKKAMNSAYQAAKLSASDTVYSDFYDSSFQRAEERHHVSNEVVISVENISDTAELQVLEVSDVQYIIHDRGDNKENITSWLEVPGKGVFTVDLTSAEFTVDTERKFVRVRVPEPVMTCSVDYSGLRLLNFKNDIFNDSTSIGEDKARDDIKQGLALITQNLTSNTQFTGTAEKSAKSIITSLVKNSNPDITDIEVMVEFY